MTLAVWIAFVAGVSLVESHGYLKSPLSRTSIFREPNFNTSMPYWWDDTGLRWHQNIPSPLIFIISPHRCMVWKHSSRFTLFILRKMWRRSWRKNCESRRNFRQRSYNCYLQIWFCKIKRSGKYFGKLKRKHFHAENHCRSRHNSCSLRIL